MNKGFLRIAFLLGALSVGLGAFGAHGLKSMIDEKGMMVFETAVRYQFYHVFAIALAAILYKERPGKLLLWAGRAFISGICLFSGSLYLLTFLKLSGNTGSLWVGTITPIGGLAFIFGWILMFLSQTGRS